MKFEEKTFREFMLEKISITKKNSPLANIKYAKKSDDKKSKINIVRSEEDFEEENKSLWKSLKKIAGGFTIDINNSKKHNLYQRIKDRTKNSQGIPASFKEIKNLFVKIIKEIKKRYTDGLIEKPTMFEVKPKGRDFKLLVFMNPKNLFLRVSTILSKGMKTKDTEEIKISESRKNTLINEAMTLDYEFFKNININEIEVVSMNI